MKKLYTLIFASLLFFSASAQYLTDSFDFGGVSRKFLLYVPPSYDGSVAMPFVLVLHGLGDNMNNFKGIRMDRVADTANFIFAIPQALVDGLSSATAWNSGAGAAGITLNPTVDDVGFLNALIDTAAARYNIDQTRLYSTGFSMGGFMSNRLACELNNRIAAIASVSGTIGNGLTCHSTRVVPVAHFHGTADQTVAYSGNLFGNDAEALVRYWTGHDHCDTTPAYIDTFPHVAGSLKIVHFKYPNGAYASDVEFFKVLGGVHQWLGPSGYDINYAVEIWKFFRRYKWEPQAIAGIKAISENEFTLSPNPTHTFITCHIADITNGPVIQMFDMLGLLSYSLPVTTHDITLPVSQLPTGIYIVKVATADGWNTSHKIVVE